MWIDHAGRMCLDPEDLERIADYFGCEVDEAGNLAHEYEEALAYEEAERKL